MKAPTPHLSIGPDLDLPLDLVTEATAIVATRGAGKTSTSVVIIEESFDAGVQTIVFDRTGVYWGLRSNTKGKGDGLPIYVLGGPHGDAPLEPTAGSVIADLAVDAGHSFVLDLSDFSKGNAVRFTADFLEQLYDRKARSRSTTLLILDEAHFYAPQTPRGGFKGDSARLMGAMEDVVGLGRSRGLGVILTTQRTQSLNKAVLDLIETLFVMRMLSPRARDAVKDWIREKQEDDRLGIMASLDSLPTGTAWVWSPLRDILQKVAVRRIRTFDSYATPKPGETRVEPTRRKELDLDALGEQIAATVERKKADDPKHLRDRIRELELQVDRLSQVEPPQPVVEYVEVATIDPEWLEGFTTVAGDLVERLRDLGGRLEQYPTELPTAAPLAGPRRTDAGQPRRAARVAPTAPTRSSTRPAGQGSNTDSDLPPARRKLLTTLVQLESIHVTQPPKNQVALFAGVSPKSSGYTNNLGALRSAGMIDYPGPGLVQLTDLGRRHADPVEAVATDDELHAQVQSLLPPARWRILEVLLDVWPDSIDKPYLADEAGVSPTSSGFTNNLGALRSLGLIDYPAPGRVEATDLLFLGGAR